MNRNSLRAVLTALNEAEASYLTVGGVAVNLHGYGRATQDLDLVLELSESNALRALRALGSLGYRPRVPVSIEDFANSRLREEWRSLRNMEVFSLFSDRHPSLTVDLFVHEPFPFKEVWSSSPRMTIFEDVEVRVVPVSVLVEMKQEAGRPRDLDDVAHLLALHPTSEDTDE